MHMKENIPLEELTESVPKEIYDYFVELRNVRNYGIIDYNKLAEIFYELLEKEGIKYIANDPK